MSDENLKKELAAVFNVFGTDTDTNTPDFILADIALDAIRSFRRNAQRRDEWRNIPPWAPGQRVTITDGVDQ